MADANIDFEVAVGKSTLEDGGYVGRLLQLGFAHISKEMAANRLLQKEAGQVYVSLIQVAYQQGLKFTLDEQVSEAQIDNLGADADLKINQLKVEKDKAEAELEKHWGYLVTRDEEDNLVLGDSTGLGKIDEEVDYLITQDSELIANGLKDREIKTEQVIEVQEKVDLLESQNLEVIASTVRSDAKQADNELTSEQNRLNLIAQALVYDRQRLGYEDNKHQKVLESAMSYLGITRQDEDVPTRPTITYTDEGMDELFKRTMRDYTDVDDYDTRPIAATLNNVVPSGTMTVGHSYSFDISKSIDYDGTIDFTTLSIYAYAEYDTPGSPASTPQLKINPVQGEWRYNSVTRLMNYTVTVNLGASYPTPIWYTIKSLDSSESYAAKLSFSA